MNDRPVELPGYYPMTGWQAFWNRILSIDTARFILALMSLCFASGLVMMLMTGIASIDESKEALVNFALGQMFALSMVAFHGYFGRPEHDRFHSYSPPRENYASKPPLPLDGFEKDTA